MACGLLPGGRHARLHQEELRDLPEHEGILHLGRQALSCGRAKDVRVQTCLADDASMGDSLRAFVIEPYCQQEPKSAPVSGSE